MRVFLSFLLCAAALSMVAPEPASAGLGVIDRACRQSNRPAATPQMCGCIQEVANSTLNRTERRKVARWFKDPHQAQVVRQSDRRSDAELWERYQAFGDLAARTCR
ncbi:MAG: hypothetical protein ACK5MY_03535 [Jhaorihella sp.]